MPPLLKITNFYKFNFSHFLHWMIFFPKVSLLVKCPTAFAKDDNVWSKLLWITGRWHSCHFLSGQKASATNLPDVSFYRIRPLTSSNPGFWGQCQVPEDFDKCLTSKEEEGCFLTPCFWGQCQPSSLRIKINMQTRVRCCLAGRSTIFRIKVSGIFRHLRNSRCIRPRFTFSFLDLSPIWAIAQYFSDATELPVMMDPKYGLSPKR